ncbi:MULTISPECIES: helix-turn-helix domain-containing protein [unclassified Companilactobacillus]|jgi:transcriptional regulator with XRE-family HTH domain|uniref:helix-turn-helix domain-containing protein n=1 Tax=unclassified Companilactobacillus TaxID=2767904 RepID=UPI002FEF6EA7
MNNLGEKIKIARLDKHLTQQQLADQLFVTPQAVSKWENNQGSPSLDKIDDLSQILGKEINYFIGSNSSKDSYDDKRKWLLLTLNSLYYLVTLIISFSFSPKINHDFFSMIVSAIIFFIILASLIYLFNKYPITHLVRYGLIFGFFDIIWLICILALFISK